VKPWRNGVRALVLDPDDCVLLVHFAFPPCPWAAPGGGLDPRESDEHALRRELAEEVGLDEFELGPPSGRASTSSITRSTSGGNASAATSCASTRSNRRRDSIWPPST
jgi:8-oxo-dGTP pyrophosphatase MutT (NUDIX family)